MSVYDPFYTITKMTQLPPDPRAKRRAGGRAMSNVLIGFLVSLWTAQIIVAARLNFDKSLGSIIFPPWNVAIWYMHYYNRAFPSMAFRQHIHQIFDQAKEIAIAGALLSIVLAMVEYHRSKNDRSKLTTEKGDARWATPEEIAGIGPGRDPDDDSLLPEGYDLYRGFSAKKRKVATQMRQRAALYVKDKKRIANEQDAAAAEEADEETSPTSG